MIKKYICFILSVCLLFSLCACGGENKTNQPNDSSLPEAQHVKNPFTGEEIAKEKESLRPVAVVINNLNSAQKVQTGVAGADIVYETEVEGGITRLLAVYKDIEKANLFGSIRSARVVFASLAISHGAIFVHHGIDPNYAADYVRKNNITDFDTNKKPFSSYAFRKNNGMNSEHTVYSSPELLTEGFNKTDIVTTTESNASWCSFSESERVPAEGTAGEISVKFSASYISKFVFDQKTGLYTKNSAKAENSDYVSGAPYTFKNVFVLKTDISFYPDLSHRKIDLNGGEGYYYSLGGYEKIIWKKENNAPIKFFTPDGAELKVNKGNSWVCITQKP